MRRLAQPNPLNLGKWPCFQSTLNSATVFGGWEESSGKFRLVSKSTIDLLLPTLKNCVICWISVPILPNRICKKMLDYSSIIGAALGAGLTATAAFFISKWQIKVGREQLENERENKLRRQQRAARAIFLNDLNSIIEHTNKCIFVAINGGAIIKHIKEPLRLERLALPENILLRLQDLVELYDDAIADNFAEFLSDAQLADARLRDLVNSVNGAIQTKKDIPPGHTFEYTVESIFNLNQWAMDMFGFARGKSDSIDRPDLAEVKIFSAIERLSVRQLLEISEQNPDDVFTVLKTAGSL